MATDKQLEANRLNARKSTGPVTPEGRTVVSKNALKHGLFSQSSFLQEEMIEDFLEFSRDLKIELCPEGSFEMLIFDRIISLAWRLARMARIERDLLEVGRGNVMSLALLSEAGIPISGTGLGFGFSSSSDGLDKLQRYESFLQRSLSKSFEEFEKAQSKRGLRREIKIERLTNLRDEDEKKENLPQN